MKFDSDPLRDRQFETRIITKFAILPVTIRTETRWLERVTIKQRVGWNMHSYVHEWMNEKFIDSEEDKEEVRDDLLEEEDGC